MTPLLSAATGRRRLVDVVEEGVRPDLVEDDVNRQLGRAAHAWYLAQEAATPARPVATTAAWEDLDPETQADNVAQVEHIRAELEADGFVLERWNAERQSASLPSDIVKRVAISEHGRWMGARQSRGWTLGERSAAGIQHPDLKPWEALDPVAQSKDLEAVRRFPQLVASAGYQVVQQD